MAFDERWLDLVPIPPDVPELVAASELARTIDPERDPDPLFVWAIALTTAQGELRALERLPFFEFATFGFVQPEIDERDPAVAVIANVSPPVQDLAERNASHADELTRLYGRASEELSVTVGGAERFPVVVRRGDVRLERSLTAPSQALTAAWTEMTALAALEGWLTPFHAVGSRNATVSFDDGHQGSVVATFGACIDAVVVSHPNGRPSQATLRKAPMSLSRPFQLHASDQNGVQSQFNLTAVEVNVGLIGYSRSPIRLVYDWSGTTHGDSGALVTDSQGEPVAMHQGVIALRKDDGTYQTDSAGAPIRQAFGLALFQLQARSGATFYL